MQTPDFAEHSGSFTASTSLVRRVKSQDQDAWRRLARIYGWLIYRWARRSGLQVADAEDVVGEVFAEVVSGIEGFQQDGRPHSFRRWLRTLSAIHVRKHWQNKNARPIGSGGTTAGLRVRSLVQPNLHERDLEVQDEIEWLRQRAMKIIQEDYKPTYWEVFRRVSLEGEAPAAVAKSEGMSVWAVYKVQSRILHRLRVELDESV